MYKGDKWEYYPMIYNTVDRFLYRYLGDGMCFSDMSYYDDLVNAGIKALDKCINDYDDLGHSFKSYLNRGLKFAYLNEWRRCSRVVDATSGNHEALFKSIVDLDVSVENDILQKITSTEKEKQLIKALNYVKREHRFTWVAYYYDDINIQQIAKIRGSSYKKTKEVIDKVSDRLLRTLENNEAFTY